MTHFQDQGAKADPKGSSTSSSLKAQGTEGWNLTRGQNRKELEVPGDGGAPAAVASASHSPPGLSLTQALGPVAAPSHLTEENVGWER